MLVQYKITQQNTSEEPCQISATVIQKSARDVLYPLRNPPPLRRGDLWEFWGSPGKALGGSGEILGELLEGLGVLGGLWEGPGRAFGESGEPWDTPEGLNISTKLPINHTVAVILSISSNFDVMKNTRCRNILKTLTKHRNPCKHILPSSPIR